MIKSVSIIIPVYNGSTTIASLVKVLFQELSSISDLEVVLVNDGSPSDNSSEVCTDLAIINEKIKFIDLSMNFGEHNAVMAGLHYCVGDCAVIMDDDFQNPPSEVIKLIEKLGNGYDVIFSKYEKKKHNYFRNLGSSFNDKVASYIINKPSGLYLSSFKAINRFVIDHITKYNGPYPYIDGLIFRVTRNYGTVLVDHADREGGKSGYTFSKLVSLWLNMFTNFSVLPLRIATITGFVFGIIGVITAAYFIVEKITNPDMPIGWASLIVSLFIIGSLNMFAIGMVGEYLGRLFIKSNGNPQFIVRSTKNCEDKEK
jgi:polyisoprenyl-phosphate glycosyltransferase